MEQSGFFRLQRPKICVRKPTEETTWDGKFQKKAKQTDFVKETQEYVLRFFKQHKKFEKKVKKCLTFLLHFLLCLC